MPVKTESGPKKVAALWMQTARLLKNRMFDASKKVVSNPQQMFAAYMIQEHEGLTMKELADLLGITSPSTTSLVNRLVRMKWVVRMADPSNRKLVRLKLGPEGKTMLAAMMKSQTKAMGDVLSLLNERDRQDFSRILSHLHQALLLDSTRS